MGRNEGIVLDPLAIFQAPKLEVLVLKGESLPHHLVGGAVHRSSPLKDVDKRLLLKVDFVESVSGKNTSGYDPVGNRSA